MPCIRSYLSQGTNCKEENPAYCVCIADYRCIRRVTQRRILSKGFPTSALFALVCTCVHAGIEQVKAHPRTTCGGVKEKENTISARCHHRRYGGSPADVHISRLPHKTNPLQQALPEEFHPSRVPCVSRANLSCPSPMRWLSPRHRS